METTALINICAAALVIAGFLSLGIPVFLYRTPSNEAEKAVPETAFSMVVAFRNEAGCLPALFESILEVHYPHHLIELVLCNDHSDDDSKDRVLAFQKTAPFRVVYCENTNETGKKAALQTAVKNSSFDTLFFTDADCLIPPNLFNSLNNTLKKSNAVLISGPIRYFGDASLIHQYQCMESAVLMALTADAFRKKNALMANGANMCVIKSVFLQAQQVREDLNIPGGDDVFLLEYAMQKLQTGCIFTGSPENMVQTRSESTWSSLMHQRIRWAHKVRFQKGISGKIWQFFSLVFSIIYIVSICLIPFTGWTAAAIMVFGKMTADMAIQMKISPAFSYKINVFHIAVFSILQVFIIFYTGVCARFGGYVWKGREY
jgi:glycosyltransferase involved in cell wall biosynthesis